MAKALVTRSDPEMADPRTVSQRALGKARDAQKQLGLQGLVLVGMGAARAINSDM